MISENIRCFENNYHIESTCAGTWFHVDHINLRIWVIQEATSKSSEIVFSGPLLVRREDPVNKRIREGSLSRIRWNMLRGIAENAMILVLLQ
jgi:hypothetical protein